MPIRPGGARQAKLDPKLHDGAFIRTRDRSEEMLIMTSSGMYNTRNGDAQSWKDGTASSSRRWRVRRESESEGGEMAADVLPADMAVPMPALAPVPPMGEGQRPWSTSGELTCRTMGTPWTVLDAEQRWWRVSQELGRMLGWWRIDENRDRSSKALCWRLVDG